MQEVNASFYKNCRELPMHNFNEIQITNDLNYLVKDKSKQSDEDLQRHWIEILEESFELSKDTNQKKFFKDKSELIHLEVKINILHTLRNLTGLKLNNEQQKIFDFIKKKYRVTDFEQSILQTTDKINLKISQFKRQYDSEKSSNFESMLASMRINGYHVNRHEITVSEWFALIEQIKMQNSNKDATKRKR